MKAAVLKQIGDDKLDIRTDAATTGPGPEEVRVRIRASGICHSDVSAMNGSLPTMAPGVMGHEGAGEVLETGSAVTDLDPGDRVVISFVPPCGGCPHCLRGQPNLCEVHTVAAFTSPRFEVGEEPAFGFGGCGTFAEEVVVPRSGAIKVDDEVPFEVGALLGCGVLTGVGAVINTAAVEPGSTVAVIGCGGVGISVIQGARLAGATRIVAVDPDTDKHASARRFGATHVTTPDGLQELNDSVTSGSGFDYAFEVVGLAATIRTAYDATRRGGSVVVVGAGGPEQKIEFTAQELFITERKILPSFYGSADPRRDVGRMVEFWRAGLLDLEGMVSTRMSLDDVNAGLDALKDGTNGVVRQIVTVD
ncbi:S-(hydroxymethyl)glutathione dehydrogenase/alcohol dehydrogenase [Halopolyspora algeriensis]|uniref:S-(Hydroxymethyl)glutathione dehydrogenase/alcohol dehydrogenase n=1 Tax=Halopolyspora algeriensis TaxID=1500506 RepID=A0A368VTL2_9ACTN|nr:Zn-dependent alcohol dehydrogenase [Halopolyspora algeriensis]RCW44536.1 S-(hydroxymethyl)glutathione dehydrogenase/alcohol dehydrogenase [Halopolyspora algeriensis]TQM55896.1 S-(hydroxymethyl)glutathione dehydrogenase/alcohol dehydrogenase [Halopolyspora algeriensis]